MSGRYRILTRVTKYSYGSHISDLIKPVKLSCVGLFNATWIHPRASKRALFLAVMGPTLIFVKGEICKPHFYDIFRFIPVFFFSYYENQMHI